MSFVRKFIACLISIALVLAQLSAAARGTSIDVAGYGSVLSLGINGSKGGASKKWTSPSGIVTQGSLDVIVENATRLKGAVIASQTNDLQLSTRTLSTQDIALYDNDRQVSGSIGINTTINGPNGPKPSKPGFKINATYANKQIKGIARATISGGRIEVTSQTGKQTARQLASLNRNADKSLEITSVIDEGFELYGSDTSLQAAFKAGAKIVEIFDIAIRSMVARGKFSQKEADGVLAIFEKLEKSGYSPEELRNCAVGRQGSIWDIFVTPAYAGGICDAILAEFSLHDIDNCLDIWDSIKTRTAQYAANGIELFLDAYERDPDNIEILIKVLDLPSDVLTSLLSDEVKANRQQLNANTYDLLAPYLDAIIQDIADGKLTDEEAILLATIAIVSAVSFVPKSKRAKILNSAKQSLANLIKRVKGKKGGVGFTQDAVGTAFNGMREGHAIRHLQGDLIPNTGSLQSRVAAFKDLATPILINPTKTAPWRVGATDGRAFLGKVNGKNVVVVVAKGGPKQGKVITSFVPNANQLAIINSR